MFNRRSNPRIKSVTTLLLGLAIAFCSSTVLAEQRIVSLAPHITEILFAVGAGEEIVGAVSYSDYPEEALEIPRIGSYDRISYESILALQPTLIIGWDGGNGEDSLERLRQLGLNVYSHNPTSLEDVGESIRKLGELSGHAEAGEEQAESFFQQLEELRESYSERDKISLFYQIWNEPIMSINGKHLISDVIRLCGGENIYADAIPVAPKVSIESVVRLNPEVIIAAGMAGERPEWLDDWLQWPSIEAAAKGQLFSVHPDLLHRHSPRIIEGAKQMCQLLDSVR